VDLDELDRVLLAVRALAARVPLVLVALALALAVVLAIARGRGLVLDGRGGGAALMGVEIQIEGLTKSFGKQLIWGDVTLTVPAGEICVMLGPSGTGKSVFLKTLIGLLKPENGSIVIDGHDITKV
jgi:ABC-type multidrug transport system fused ATPase/permease subunit